ncbi:neural/ectodermal development factor IMP-L2 [Uranotaenia lowii]|uniref:neural/ectodermal development factor IMP-L2 n=1 Tax=Uranotaenia lowii TaxID=190385 RepID=UPI00247A6FEF|nr:neural/ectodermal development factor IMP-L2 [Uranotaenia lowii]XP_055602794.1 neural/ectodermal development factor IMP-L2 [Uranotaenia lowii]
MINLKILCLVAVLVSLAPHISGRAVDLDQDNSLSASSSGSRVTRPNFVKITSPPPMQITQVRGTTVELECEVMGSPTPYVQWVHGSGQTADWDDISMNIISESSPTTMARVVSRLVLDHSSRAAESTFTCIGRSGGQIAVASTTVYHVDPARANFTDLLKPSHNPFNRLKQTRITLHYKALFEFMGSTVILPCKAIGRPVPEITWKNEEGNVVSSMQDPRFRTLPTGELVINDLRWADMGSYTCVAKNAISKDEAETFLYPIRPN